MNLSQLWVVSSLLLVAGCGGDDSGLLDATKAIDAKPSDAASPDSSTECNPLDLDTATVVDVNQVATPAPAPTGGSAPSAGTYMITAATLYTGVGGATGSASTARGLNKIDATSFELTAVLGLTRTDEAGSYKLSGSGSTSLLTTTDTCPDTKQTQFFYSASGSGFSLYQHSGTITEEIVFTRQPQ